MSKFEGHIPMHSLLVLLQAYMSTQRESFEGQNGGPPSEARQASEGGSGVLRRKLSKTCIANGAI